MTYTIPSVKFTFYPSEGDPVMRNVSNSEVTAWLKCRRQYFYAFVLELAPKHTPTPLARGTLGHNAFQRYIEGRLQGMEHDRALKHSQSVFSEAMSTVSMEVVAETKFLFDRYMNFHKGWPEWRLLGTEQRVDCKLTDTLTMPMRYDAYVEEVRTNRRLIVDWKFTYDFWSPEDHDLNGQNPKYITVMNNNGQRVDGAVLVELRTRKLGAEKSADSKNLWRHTSYFPSLAKKRNVLKQHIAASLEIERYRNLDPKAMEDATIPVLDKHGACKYCNFKELCITELDGGDPSVAIELGFVKNTYGYNEQNIEEVI